MNLPKKILSWYDNNRRTLPWRIGHNSKKNQYFRILSEFMLQQTQVKTVIPYFTRFVNKVPNLKTLSKSSEKKILKLWEGLGYYRRAKNLRKTAIIVVKKYNGKLPKKFEEIISLPGIGQYTANALLSLVYNKPCIPIDGNVKRIFLRLFNKDIEKCEIKKTNNKLFNIKRNADFAEALMEFGEIICRPKKPLCNICNLKKHCKFFKNENYYIEKKKNFKKEKKYNIYCYLRKKEKEIALTENKSLSFLKNFKMPETKIAKLQKSKTKGGWIYLCNYKKNISNIKMNINLFYKFTKIIPKKFRWHPIDKSENEFIPTFTKKIFTKVAKLYI